MTVTVRLATEDDLPWLAQHDGHVNAARLGPKIPAGEIAVAELDGKRVGLLRLDHLWSTEPFVALVRVLEPARRQGVGRALVAFVADRARAGGADVLLSSTTAGEDEPQAWHRAVGFTECGGFERPNDEPGEVFFQLVL